MVEEPVALRAATRAGLMIELGLPLVDGVGGGGGGGGEGDSERFDRRIGGGAAKGGDLGFGRSMIGDVFPIGGLGRASGGGG